MSGTGPAESTSSGGRRKLAPDPLVKTAILAAAAQLLDDDGAGTLSIARVLERTQLGTRAFYRHFESKDQLVSALFLKMAEAEVERLESLMAAAPDVVRAVAAWIDGRLALAADATTWSDIRHTSQEAQSQMLAAPDVVGPAYRAILRPLVEQLIRGQAARDFKDIDPQIEAICIQGVVWSTIERQWSTPDRDFDGARGHVQRFCLRGLGVGATTIDAILQEGPPRSRPPGRRAGKRR